jgi:UDP-2,3-diacylglucosamine pyrophosphatase LpxH
MASSINIVIQDVVYDPVGRDVEGEYVIIANQGPDAVDMSGWTLRDSPHHRQRAPYTFKFPSFILAPGSLVRVHTGSGINDADDLYWGRGAAAWTNTGDTAVLSDERGRKISRFTFAVQTVPAQPFLGTVVISDIHIGDNSRTCWYQKTVHEQYLLALMDWIIDRATGKDPVIDRLIILGDLFDFWTYPPDQRPPTTQQILDANPKIFGPDGKMRKVMDALNGNVLYVHGNHDINISQADLDLIPTGPNKIKLVDDIYYDSDGIVYTHGHLFTMFNAPDPRFPGDVPVGHFVTRAVAYYVDNMLPAGETAAELPDQGSPYGFDLSSFIPALSGQFSNPSVTSALLDYISARTGLTQDYPIVMADGTVTSIAEVKAKYDYLWTSWVAQSGGGQFGETVAAKAAQADYDGTYMAWFAQRVAMQHGALGAVMGHTHKPKSGIQNSIIRYVNSGFECPSIPDIKALTDPAHFNFAIVDSQSNLQLWQVVNEGTSFEVRTADAPADQVVFEPFMDYSCYVRITNNTNNELVKQAQDAQYGNYVVPPPNRIPTNTTVDIWLQDFPGIHGAEGSVTYSQADGNGSMKFTFGCPTGIFVNYASGGAEFIAASGNPPSVDAAHNQVPATGHPLFVQFFASGFVETPVTPPPWTPTSLLALAVYAAGFLYDPGQDIIYSRMDPLQRRFGYAFGYDAAALGMDAILDCEPIFFDYAGKHWMIELWKGQYGLETGCEIGVYNRPIGSNSPVYALLDATIGRRPGDANPSHNLFFDCANDNELLEMSSTLYKNGQRLFSRGPEKHWWLTSFKWGVYSRPDELTMEVSITCLDTAMCAALVGALQDMGYNVNVSSTTARFRFTTPTTHQPRSDTPAIIRAVEATDQGIVNGYNAFGFPTNDPNAIPDRALATIMNAVGGIYSLEFFGKAVANLANRTGFNAYDVINGLAQAFNIGIDVVTDLAAQAGFVFSNWVSSVENALGINLDFSCVVEISNRGDPYDLILENHAINHGNYVVRPPDRIGADRVGRFWLKDPKPTPFGADGWVQYYYVDSANNRHSVRFTYACPTGFASNVASTSAPFNFYTKSGNVNSHWSGIDQIITGGHPLFVAFVYGNTPAPS